MLIKPKATMYIKNFYKDFKGFKLKFILIIFLSLLFVWIAITGFNNRGLGNLSRLGERMYKTNTLETYNNFLEKDVATLIKIFDNDYEKVKSGTINHSMAKSNADYIINNFATSHDSFNYWIEKKTLPEEDLGHTEKTIESNNKKTTIAVYSQIYEPYNWTICASYNKSELENNFNTYHDESRAYKIKIMRTTAWLGLFLIFLVCTLNNIFGLRISEWILEIRNLTVSLKQGDLTQKMIYDYKDELRETSNALNESQENMIKLISNINNIATTLKNSIEDFTDNHVKMSNSIESVSSSIYDITKNINEQTLSTSAVTSSVNDISTSIQQTANEINILQKNSVIMQNYSQKSKNSLQELISVNNRTQKDIEQMYSQTEITNNSVNRISSAANLINEIAEQTNLLSLNASIEAARAGEHGKGFSVVATEIGNLALQSAITVREINTILNELNNNSSKSIDIVTKMTQASTIQNNTLQATTEIFDELNNILTSCLNSINYISSQIETVTNERDAIQINIDKLNKMSTNNAAYTQETSAMAEDLTDIVTNSNNKIHELSKEFDNLSDSINNFKFK